MTYIQHDKIVKKINSRDGNDNRFEDNYLQNKYHTSVTAISSFARGDLIAFWVRVIQWATVVESIACAEAIGGSRTHLTRHSPVCFAGWPAWLRCSHDPQEIFLAEYSKQTQKFYFKQVSMGQISTVK